ncbi:MAG: UvrD-helicase domain-containing protein [Muribaculaceae bacterium]|nr:UvrD-helicase domain-containing protein [Muribaculaceae bacterium]
MLTIYKASAGSGKTYTLAFEYIKALLGVRREDGSYMLNGAGNRRRSRSRHRGILAITFTNKATEEMKERIVRELHALATDPAGAAYTAALTRLLGCSQEQLQEEAAAALHDMLTEYRHFNVSTIDSFFQGVLRTFARELDHQGDYEVELNDRYAVAAGVGMLLDDLNFGVAPREKQLKRWISGFIREKVADGQAFNFFDRSSGVMRSVVSYVHKMCDENFKPHAAATLEYLADPARLQRYRAAVRGRRKELAGQMAAAAQGALDALDAEAAGRAICNASLLKLIETAATGTVPDKDKLGLGSREAKTFAAALEGDETKIFVKGKLPKSGRSVLYPAPGVAAAVQAACGAMRRAAVQAPLLDGILSATPALEFLGMAWKYVADFRRDNNLVLMSDTNDLVRRIINGAEVPFIYERTGMELHHFLIDEFQDTSVMQWENLRPLVANSVDVADSLIIGDEKQSIYRFRNSDSSLLHHRVAEQFPGRHTLRGSAPADNTNHRSAHGMVRFNNALFSRLAAQYDVPGYENVRQALFGKFDGLESCVRILPYTALPCEDENPKAAQYKEASLRAMAAEIEAQHARGYDWSRIAVLLRRRSEAEEVVNYLMGHNPGIPLLSNEGLRLDTSSAVRTIVSVLKFVDRSYDTSPRDDESSPFASYGDILMMLSRFEYLMGRDPSDPAGALKKAAGSDGSEALAEEAAAVRAAAAANLPALVEVIISRNVSEEQRRHEFAYIAAFQDIVLEYCARYNPSLHAFLDWWADNGSRQTVGAAATLDAVTVMTVHKAKGLEWDCVHIPFASWPIDEVRGDVWVEMDAVDLGEPADRPPVLSLPLSGIWEQAGEPFSGIYAANKPLELADHLNVTYVAFTRPRRELHVHYDPKRGIGRVLPAVLGAPHPSDAAPEGLALPEGLDENGCFALGTPTDPERERGADGAEESFPVPPYRVYFRDDTREITTVQDITAGAGDGNLGTGEEEVKLQRTGRVPVTPEEKAMAAAAERGNLLHNILAATTVAADLDRAAADTGARFRIDAATLAAYTALLRDAMESSEHAARWFSPGNRVLAERTIYEARTGRSYRPDRLVLYPDGSVDVVDYKFTSETHDEHRRQVGGYMRLLREMGHTAVRGYLWYPEQRLVQEVQ